MVVSHRESSISSNIRAIIEQLNLNPVEREHLQRCNASIKQLPRKPPPPTMKRPNVNNPDPIVRPKVTIGVYGLKNEDNNNRKLENIDNREGNDRTDLIKKLDNNNSHKLNNGFPKMTVGIENNKDIIKRPIWKVEDSNGKVEESPNKIAKKADEDSNRVEDLIKTTLTKVQNISNKLENNKPNVKIPTWKKENIGQHWKNETKTEDLKTTFTKKNAIISAINGTNNENTAKNVIEKVENSISKHDESPRNHQTLEKLINDDSDRVREFRKKPIWQLENTNSKVDELQKRLSRKFENGYKKCEESIIKLEEGVKTNDESPKNTLIKTKMSNYDEIKVVESLKRPMKKIENVDMKLISVELVSEIQKQRPVNRVVARPRQRLPSRMDIDENLPVSLMQR